MSSTIDPLTGSSLTDTLTLALTQCQDQVRRLAEQDGVIENLNQENERLRQELDTIRAKSNTDLEAKYAAQFQDVFRIVAEKQGEIDKLKTKLYNVKIKIRQRGLPEPTSSLPVSSSGNVETSSPQILHSTSHRVASDKQQDKDASVINAPAYTSVNPLRSPPRKRPRSLSPPQEPLQEVSINTEFDIQKPKRSNGAKSNRQSRTEQSIAAIPELAEDGDNNVRKPKKSGPSHKSKETPGSVYNRLGDLLDTRGPPTPALLRARSSSPPQRKSVLMEATPVRSAPYPSGLPTPATETRPKRPRSSLGSLAKRVTTGDEDDEPFRSRPFHRLGLTHFKLNPANNSGLDFAYNEVTRGRDRRCYPGCTRECCVGTFRALAETMSHAQGVNQQNMSNDELLLEYLGSGSEERIRSLTPKARENLIHDARTKLMANAYGKMHRDAHQRGKSPPGFWRTDMPGSQEHRDDLAIAKSAERNEVLVRYNDALKGGGRWIFADE